MSNVVKKCLVSIHIEANLSLLILVLKCMIVGDKILIKKQFDESEIREVIALPE